MSHDNVLVDVSRLVRLAWTGQAPTGIDRVSRAYMEHFTGRAEAVVQHRGRPVVLRRHHSEELFAQLRDQERGTKRRLARLLACALVGARHRVRRSGTPYFNVGHTNLEYDRMVQWTDLCSVRPIYMVHDLIPLNWPEFCGARAVDRHRRRVVNALRSAAGVITNSRAVADDLRHFADRNGLPQPPTLAAWLGCTPFPHDGPAISCEEPWFVTVGTVEGRKNHFLLLQVWRRIVAALGDAAPRLVIIGRRGAFANHVEAMLDRCDAIAGKVTILNNANDAEVAPWIRFARALLMPSFAEGFGLPVIEAMQAGTPVIASDLPCFREIGDGLATLLDPLDGPAWERTICEFARGGSAYSGHVARLGSYVAPSWTDHFAKVETWLTEIAS